MSFLAKLNPMRLLRAIGLGGTTLAPIGAALMAATPMPAIAQTAAPSPGIDHCLTERQAGRPCTVQVIRGGSTVGMRNSQTPWGTFRANRIAAVRGNADKMLLNDVWDLLEEKTREAGSGVTIADLRDADRDRAIVVDTRTGRVYAFIRNTTNVGDLDGDGDVEGDFIVDATHTTVASAQAAYGGANVWFCNLQARTVTTTGDVVTTTIPTDSITTTTITPPVITTTPITGGSTITTTTTNNDGPGAGVYVAGSLAPIGDDKGSLASSSILVEPTVRLSDTFDITARVSARRDGVLGNIGLADAVVGPRINLGNVFLQPQVGYVSPGSLPASEASPTGFNSVLAGQSDTNGNILSRLGYRGTLGLNLGNNTTLSTDYTSTFSGTQTFNQLNVNGAFDNGKVAVGASVTPLLNLRNRDGLPGVDSTGFGAALGVRVDFDGRPGGLSGRANVQYGRTTTTIGLIPGAEERATEWRFTPQLVWTSNNGRWELGAGPFLSSQRLETVLPGRGTNTYSNTEVGGLLTGRYRYGYNSAPGGRDIRDFYASLPPQDQIESAQRSVAGSTTVTNPDGTTTTIVGGAAPAPAPIVAAPTPDPVLTGARVPVDGAAINGAATDMFAANPNANKVLAIGIATGDGNFAGQCMAAFQDIANTANNTMRTVCDQVAGQATAAINANGTDAQKAQISGARSWTDVVTTLGLRPRRG